MKISLSACFLFLSSLLQVHAQDFNYLDPTVIWSQRTTDDTSAGVLQGNGIYLSPDNKMIVSTSSDGTLRAFDPSSGNVLWTYVPETLGYAIRCFSGATFSYKGATPYIVYAVADGATDKTNSPQATTRVIAVDTTGNLVFQSSSIDGIAAGTPVTSSDGSHILLTHNIDAMEGYLSIFSTGSPDPIYSENYSSTESGANGTVATTNPFSPLGYYHNPTAGWYDGGANNTNDVFFFAWDTPKTATSIESTDGQVFVFQFPMDYAGDGQGLGFVPMGSRTDFHAITGPVLTNGGLSMYWTVTKATTDCYLGEAPLARTYFSRGRTNRATFDRAERPAPAYQAPRAQPTLSSDPVQPMVYGVGAAAQIWSMNYDYTVMNVAATPDLVSSRLLLTQDEQYIIYATQATVSTSGGVHMVPVSNLAQVEWTTNVTGGVYGDIALNGRGTIVYAADVLGQISAYQFGENFAATPAPTLAPTQVAVPTALPESDEPTPAFGTIDPTPSGTGPDDGESPAPNAPSAPTDPTASLAPGAVPSVPPPADSSASSQMATLIFGLASMVLAFTL